MKTISKFIKGLFVAGLLVFGLTAPADAQRAGHLGGYNRMVLNEHTGTPASRSRGFYHPYVYPTIGVVVHALPSHYYHFLWGTYPYYYCDGLFYQAYANGSYKLAAPPIGAEVPSLPFDAEIITIDNNPYYVYQGIYYEPVIHPDGKAAYKVAGKDGILNTNGQSDPDLPLVGDMIDQLPDGSHRLTLSSKTYWVTPDEVYLEEVKKDEKNSYRVVWVPDRKKDLHEPANDSKNL